MKKNMCVTPWQLRTILNQVEDLNDALVHLIALRAAEPDNLELTQHVDRCRHLSATVVGSSTRAELLQRLKGFRDACPL